jgi:hypothetical protein
MRGKRKHREDVRSFLHKYRGWCGKYLAESLLVWNQAMMQPVLRILPANGMIPQATVILVFALHPIFRHFTS